jgi:hypothetical protein
MTVEARTNTSSYGRFGRHIGTLAILGLATVLPASQASAFGSRVKVACANDYYAHCSQFPSNSPQVRSCMRQAGAKLSQTCFNALVAAGEVTEQEVARRTARSKE